MCECELETCVREGQDVEAVVARHGAVGGREGVRVDRRADPVLPRAAGAREDERDEVIRRVRRRRREICLALGFSVNEMIDYTASMTTH